MNRITILTMIALSIVCFGKAYLSEGGEQVMWLLMCVLGSAASLCTGASFNLVKSDVELSMRAKLVNLFSVAFSASLLGGLIVELWHVITERS